MIFRRPGTPTKPASDVVRIPLNGGASRFARRTSLNPVLVSRTLKLLVVICIGTLFILWCKISELWPETIDTVTTRNDWVDPDTIQDDQKLDTLPKVTIETFFDIEIDGEYVGRVVMGLFGDTVPKTAENFAKLCSGELAPNLHYKNMRFHRIIKGFIVQGGDITNGDGTGSVSVYGYQFDDEPAGLSLKHDRKYLLQMANSGPNTNGSQFCFMLGDAPHLNGHHVVFGRVLSGFDVVDKMGLAGGNGELPTKNIVVVDSGIVHPPLR